MVNYYSKLNRAIYKRGETFGPSLVHALLYSPIKELIAEDNKKKLRTTEKAIDNFYEGLILPMIPNLILGITGDSKIFPKNMNNLENILKGRNVEDWRKKLRDSYEKRSEEHTSELQSH